MKKLFLTAIVAVVAVCGAYADDYYEIGEESAVYYCPPGLSICNIKYGKDPIVSPTPPPDQPIQVRLSTVPWNGLSYN